MRRFISAVFALLAMLLLLATAALWVRSYYFSDALRWSDREHWQACLIAHGRVLYLRTSKFDAASAIYPLALDHQIKGPSDDVKGGQWLVTNTLDFVGFSYGSGASSPYRGWVFIVPFWFPAVVFTAVPVLWFRGRRKRKRLFLVGHCSRCGYDLRATPDRCPECGHVPAAVK